jgi:hypothetical protein
MNFSEIPKRLALVLALQMAACIYLVLGVGALIKIRQLGDQSAYYYPISAFSLWFKAHGWLLMILPLGWYWFHVRQWKKSGADFQFLAGVVASGIAILALLCLAAFVASWGIFKPIHVY